MPSVPSKVHQATAFLRAEWDRKPRVGIVLGSGLGGFAEHIKSDTAIEYSQIPHFCQSTVIGHAGRLLCGSVGSVPTVAMNGRFHCYEGHSLSEAAFPIRVMAALGIEYLIVSNASGGLHPLFHAGDIMVIESQINLMFGSPLHGNSSDPDKVAPESDTRTLRPQYDQQLIAWAREIALHEGIPIHQGVYASVTGPNYETRAEIRMLRKIGADVIGMSTIPEVIVANQLGVRVLGVSAITNKCSPDLRVKTSGDHVVIAAESTQPKMRDIVLGLIERLD